MIDLDNIRQRTQSAAEYMEGLKDTDKNKAVQLDKYANYTLDPEVVEKLRGLIDDITIVSFGASWCKDCREAVPVLRHLEEQVGLEVRIFGTVKTAPLDPKNQWAVPPSPPEIREWGATAIPWIEIFRKDGNRVGTIIEKPTMKPTLEAEILHVLKG